MGERRSNCLIFALGRFFRRGGYLIVRASRMNRLPWLQWPHFLWAQSLEDLIVEQYVPEDARPKWLPPILFRGRVKVGPDKEDG